ncbi:hypothetical protein imdm_1348 [gamma proteobacterium IMCC2047]|nr:hypothetical protein imdm_1348 [gamma proteobacterium IMCC2047]
MAFHAFTRSLEAYHIVLNNFGLARKNTPVKVDKKLSMFRGD